MVAVVLAAIVAAPLVPRERYAEFCRALLTANKAALETLLAADFTSVDTSGHAESRGAYIADMVAPGTVSLERCGYTVTSRRTVANEERDRAIWRVSGTYHDGSASGPFTAVGQSENSWAWRDGRWQMRGQITYVLKQWVNGAPIETQTYVPPPSPARRAAVVAGLRKYANPLRTAYPGGADSDLAPILRAAGTSSVVGMGEGSHGTSEFFALKDRVFRYLVEHGGVTVFAQETNWSDGQNIESYLQTGEGNLRDLLAATFPVWDNQETLDLLQWMRAYNVAHPHALHFFGIDMQSPKDAAESVMAFYKQYGAANAERIAGEEKCVDVPLATLYKSPHNDGKCIAATHEAFEAIAKDAGLEAKAGREAYLEAFHAADVAQEAAVMWSAPDLQRQAEKRDQAMAHNVEWMLSTLYPKARVFLWAHNGHIGVGAEAWKSMGTYLRAALGSNYFAIGQTFDHGDVSLQINPPAYVPPSTGNGSELVFRQAGIAPFFLDFARVPASSALGAWLAQPHGIREIGAIWVAKDVPKDEPAIRLPSAFDAITFVDAAHAAHSFELSVHRAVAFPPSASGWASSVPWTFRSYAADDATAGAKVLADGKPALYLAATPQESHLSAWLETRVDASAYRGETVRLHGTIATSAVTTGTQMSIGAYGKEGRTPLTAVARGPATALAGTNGWTPVDVTFAVPRDAQTIAIQFLLKGGGTAWVSGLNLSNDPSVK